MPATSPRILAAVTVLIATMPSRVGGDRSHQPGQPRLEYSDLLAEPGDVGDQLGGEVAARAGRQRGQRGGHSLQPARAGQPGGAGIQLGSQVVQVPAQLVDRLGAGTHQVVAAVAQQPQLGGHLVELGGRQVRLTHRRAGDGQRVDRVGRAAGAGAGPTRRHQLRRYPHHARALPDQRADQPAGHPPTVLDGPPPPGAVPVGPGPQPPEPVGIGGDGQLAQLAAGLVDGHRGVAALVRIDPNDHHGQRRCPSLPN